MTKNIAKHHIFLLRPTTLSLELQPSTLSQTSIQPRMYLKYFKSFI